MLQRLGMKRLCKVLLSFLICLIEYRNYLQLNIYILIMYIKDYVFEVKYRFYDNFVLFLSILSVCKLIIQEYGLN